MLLVKGMSVRRSSSAQLGSLLPARVATFARVARPAKQEQQLTKLHAWPLDQNPVPDPKLSVALSVADSAHLPPELACVSCPAQPSKR